MREVAYLSLIFTEIGALLLKCVLIVYIWPEKKVYMQDDPLKTPFDLHPRSNLY